MNGIDMGAFEKELQQAVSLGVSVSRDPANLSDFASDPFSLAVALFAADNYHGSSL